MSSCAVRRGSARRRVKSRYRTPQVVSQRPVARPLAAAAPSRSYFCWRASGYAPARSLPSRSTASAGILAKSWCVARGDSTTVFRSPMTWERRWRSTCAMCVVRAGRATCSCDRLLRAGGCRASSARVQVEMIVHHPVDGGALGVPRHPERGCGGRRRGRLALGPPAVGDGPPW